MPGNLGLTTKEKSIRVNALFEPYHKSISQMLDKRSHRPNVLLSMHSFIPVLNGKQRPWQIGVCYGHDRRLAKRLIKALAGRGDLIVGDNEPYAIEDDSDYTIPVHAELRGLPNAMIEIRQDELRTATGVATWAARLAEVYLQIEAEVL